MLQQATIWITFAAYLLFLLAVAAWEQHRARTRSARSFLTAGGSISWPLLVMTYLASLMSTWVFFAGPGGYYHHAFAAKPPQKPVKLFPAGF